VWIDERDPQPRNLEEKLEVFDIHCEEAVDFLLSWISENRDELIAKARSRHISGHHVHGDGELFEFTPEQLKEERIEELADAVVYQTRLAFLDIEAESAPNALRA
jgi:hypothetical protein